MGHPMYGPLCDMMRRTRLQFKYLLEQCQQRKYLSSSALWCNCVSGINSYFFSEIYSKIILYAIKCNLNNKCIALIWTISSFL